MRKVIDGVIYDTSKAYPIGTADNLGTSADSVTDFSYWEATLYRTPRKRRFFLHGKGGAMSRFGQSVGRNSWGGGTDLIPMATHEALEWAEKHLPTSVVEGTFADLLEEVDHIAANLEGTVERSEIVRLYLNPDNITHPLGPAAVHPWWNLTDAERDEVSQRITGGEVVASPEQRKDFFFLRLASGRTVQGVYGWDDSDPTEWSMLIMGDE